MQNYFGGQSFGTGFNYMMNNWSNWGMPATPGIFFGLGSLIMLALIAWVLYWKGTALWKAARLGEKWWFIALLIVNTLGILEILYIYFFSKKNTNNGQKDDSHNGHNDHDNHENCYHNH